MKTHLTDRFWAKVNKHGPKPAHRPQLGRCWLWTASCYSSGYGQFWVADEGVLTGAHRFSFRLKFGSVPEGQSVLHKCDNKLCVRPSHLFVGTQLENIRDMKRKGRVPIGEQRPNTKLTETAVSELRRRQGDVSLVRRIAREFGASIGYVRSVARGNKWRHVS